MRNMTSSARYFDEDFDWNEHARSIESSGVLMSLPPLTDLQINIEAPNVEGTSEPLSSVQDDNWNSFFDSHEEGMIYKPRRYLIPEFGSYWEKEHLDSILEVGCGYGCACFPIMSKFPSKRYIATDCSAKALEIFSNKLSTMDASIRERVDVQLWDITESPSPTIVEISNGVGIILSVFALSAVPPSHHLSCLQRFTQLLSSTSDEGYILFRDYGMYDMTMFRHRIRLEDNLFARQDQTLCYYFSLEYLANLVAQCGLRVVELKYATVINRNRKTNEEMRRVFVHGVFAK